MSRVWHLHHHEPNLQGAAGAGKSSETAKALKRWSEREEEENDRETVARALLAAAVVAASSMSSMDGPMQMTTAQGTPPGNPTPGTIGGGGILFTVPK